MPNLAGILEERAVEVPDRVGLYVDGGEQWTFAALDDAAARLARALADRGIGPGDRVGCYLPNGSELVLTLFAAWKLGAVPVTTSSLYTPEELAESVAKTQPHLLLSDGGGIDTAHTISDQVPVLLVGASGEDGVVSLDDTVPGAPLGHPAPDLSSDADAVILFTGGTTGAPKAVTVTHGGVEQALTQLAAASKGGAQRPYAMTPPEVSPNLVALPLFHSGGQHSFLFAWFVGRSIVLMERFRAARLAELVPRFQIDNLFLMPTMLFDLVEHEPRPDLTSVRSVLVSGQALDPNLRARFERRFEIPILSNYGATELGHVAGWTAKDLREGRWKPGAAGRVYDGVEIEIRGEDGTVLDPGQPGEICVRTSITRGYVGEDGQGEGATALIRDGWVHSGDIGYLDEDRVLFLVGRAREMIKVGGFQVWPSELERALHEHPAVLDVAVVGVPDPRMGEIPKAFVVPAGGHPPGDALAQELIDHTRDRLARFKAIRDVAFVPSLPRSEAGKVQRGALARLG